MDAADRISFDFSRLTQQDIQSAVWGASHVNTRSDLDLNPSMMRAWPRNQALRRASVLCPIIQRRDGLHLILTRRADHLNAHAGQIAFPGGKVDTSDPSPLAAALREASEEIGLPPDQVDVIGAIPPYELSTGYMVRPFIGFVAPSFHPIANDTEVAEVFETPLSFLMDPNNHLRTVRLLRGERHVFWSMTYNNRFIWGATAGMIKTLSDRLIAELKQR